MASVKKSTPIINLAVDGRQISTLNDLQAEILSSIQRVYGDLRILPADTKAKIVRDLDDIGFMAMRNAVNNLARQFGVTRACIYNWVKSERQRKW